MPDAWFPQPGIPTDSEVARIKAQVSKARYLVLWWEYRTFDLWNTPDFVSFHSQFTKVYESPNHCFTVLERLPAP